MFFFELIVLSIGFWLFKLIDLSIYVSVYLFPFLSPYQSFPISIFHLTIHPSSYLPTSYRIYECITFSLSLTISIYLFICLSIYLSVDLYFYIPICLPVYLYIYLSVYLDAYLSIYIWLSIYIFICLNICLSTYLSITNLLHCCCDFVYLFLSVSFLFFDAISIFSNWIFIYVTISTQFITLF